MVEKKVWMPMRRIKRDGKGYVYANDIRNDPDTRKSERKHNEEHGRKVVFVVDKNDKKLACMYVSSKFYSSLCRVPFPQYGKDTL